MTRIESIEPRIYTPIDEIPRKHESVVKGFQSGKTLDLDFRKDQLRNLYYALSDNEQLLKDALVKDFHRSPFETEFLELYLIYSDIDAAISNLDKWAADESLGGDIRMAAARPVLRKHPFGSVLIFGPWNYPYLCTIGLLVAAIAAGNTVVLKPTEMAPYSTEALCQVLEKALHPSVFQAVCGSVVEAEALLNLKWDKIAVTGSCNVGRIVSTAAAKHLTPVLLELGGKSPAIVARNADIATAARRIAWGRFANSGQTCVAPDYVVVDLEVKDRFVAEVIKIVKQMYPDLTKESVDYTHIVNERLWDRASKLVESTKGKVEFQLGTPDRESKFYPPTIVSNVSPDDALMQEEIFGPLLPIVAVDDVEISGIDVVHQHDHPLAAYIFTNESKQADRILNKVRSGSAVINDVIVQAGSTAIPFGGVNNSGTGRYHGKFGFFEFSHSRPVLRQPLFMEPLLRDRYPPYRNSSLKKLRFLSVPRAWFPRHGPVKRTLFQQLLRCRVTRWTIVLFVLFFIKGRLF